MLTKIISGGQTGADQGGLRAGKLLALDTGGTAPPGWITDTGKAQILLCNYGLVEGAPDPRKFPKRTKRNILDSDGTVIFGNVQSPGSRLTAALCYKENKPCIVNPTIANFRQWIIDEGVKVLNVAGNRERKNPGISNKVTSFLVEALSAYRQGR